jgi:hypothetical protein
MDDLLTEEEAIAAYETNNPADDHPTGVIGVAKAQREKTLNWVVNWGDGRCPHSTAYRKPKRRECASCWEDLWQEANSGHLPGEQL